MMKTKQYLGYSVWAVLALPMIALVLTSYILAPIIALPTENDGSLRYMVVQKSTDGTNWSTAFGDGLSGINNTSGTSIEDVLVTTQPMKLRIISASNGLNAGVWLRLQVM